MVRPRRSRSSTITAGRPSDAKFTVYAEEVGATTTLLVERVSGLARRVTPVEATLLMLGIYEDTAACPM